MIITTITRTDAIIIVATTIEIRHIALTFKGIMASTPSENNTSNSSVVDTHDHMIAKVVYQRVIWITMVSL